jgi:hypothetical protein
MNHKHIACGIVALLILMLVMVTQWVQGKRDKMQAEARSAQDQEDAATAQLSRERAQIGELKRQSADLIEFLRVWQPYFSTFNSAQSADVAMQMRVKDANLVNLSQRFEEVAVKNNASIPTARRSLLTFDDDYAKLLNWLGDLEKTMPTISTASVHLAKGTRPSDLRMEVILEQPMLKQ